MLRYFLKVLHGFVLAAGLALGAPFAFLMIPIGTIRHETSRFDGIVETKVLKLEPTERR
jgi:hypothetical protein